MDITGTGRHQLNECPGGGCRAVHVLPDGSFVDEIDTRRAAEQDRRAKEKADG